MNVGIADPNLQCGRWASHEAHWARAHVGIKLVNLHISQSVSLSLFLACSRRELSSSSMADRYFPNAMPDFVPEASGDDAGAGSAKDSLSKLLHLPHATLSEKLKKSALDLKDTVLPHLRYCFSSKNLSFKLRCFQFPRAHFPLSNSLTLSIPISCFLSLKFCGLYVGGSSCSCVNATEVA